MFPDLKSNLQELTLTPIWINVLEKPTEIANFFFFFSAFVVIILEQFLNWLFFHTW